MSNIDEFSKQLLEEAKRFWEKSGEGNCEESKFAHLHAALLLGSSALEAHLNAISDELMLGPRLDITDKSILSEKEIRLVGGRFCLEGQKLFRVIDKIEYLVVRFGGKEIDKSQKWWGDIQFAINLRNQITHPRSGDSVDRRSVERALTAILETINRVYMAVYNIRVPVYSAGLSSKLSF